MNAERLHLIARKLRQEISQLKIVELLGQLRDSLQQQVNQPQHSQFQQNVSQRLTELYKALEKAPSEDFSPAWRQILEEIGIIDLLGKRLADGIRGIFERNQITPASALTEINALYDRVNRLQEALGQIVSGFQTLRISAEELGPGQCELGVLVPRSAVENKLGEFADELREIRFMLGIFSELVTGKRGDFEIRTISSTDLSVYLFLAPSVAACIACAVDWILRTYKQLLDIRKSHAELKKQGVPEAELKGVENYANNLMEAAIEKAIPEIIKAYGGRRSNAERGNELANGLRITLNKIANRIDRGFNIEIRVEPIKETDPAQKITGDEAASVATIMKLAKSLEFIKVSGPPLLKLPEQPEKKPRRSRGQKRDESDTS